MKQTISIFRFWPFFLIIPALCIVSTGCRKNNSSTNPQVIVSPLDAQLKSDYNFKPGSYWVYVDSVNGETDSAYIISNSIANQPVASCVMGNVKYENEELYLNIGLVCTSVPDNSAPNSVAEKWTLRASVMSIIL